MRTRLPAVLIILSVTILEYSFREPRRGLSAPVAPRAAQQSRPRIPITGIQVILTCDKVKASMAEDVVFDVAILNIGTNNAYIFDRLWWGEGGGLLFWFRDGKEERFRPSADPPYPPPPMDDLGLFVRLEPGRFYGVRERWHAKDLGRAHPGKYTLWVEFEGPAFRENVYDAKFDRDKIPDWFYFQGVNSNQIDFEIVP
jgi:hypothetical protein